ncbi:MAG: lipoyl synthase [Planctomycetota bacterium]
MGVSTRFPPWLKKRIPSGGRTAAVGDVLTGLGIHTVCQSARCPNRCECFARGTATFMILGDVCTRNCRFCAVPGGSPPPLEADEPERVAEASRRLGLEYVVITSVTRDDLPDGGAGHFAATVRAVRETAGAKVEVLTPDFQGNGAAIDAVIESGPVVYNHNVETVPRLYGAVRPEADYRRSLGLLEHVARDGRCVPKSGLMVGLGERPDEVLDVMDDLVGVGCQMLTIGQYLRPTKSHHAVAEFVTPATFERYREAGLARGLRWVGSGPFVRSSYRAESAYASALEDQGSRRRGGGGA